MLSFLVRRRDAEVAPIAERRARWSGAMGTSRLIAFFGAADSIVYVSKILSCVTSQDRLPHGLGDLLRSSR